MSKQGKTPLTFRETIRVPPHNDIEPPRECSESCKHSKDNDAPIIAPLDNLEQVFSWEGCPEDSCVPSIALRPRTDHNGGSRMDDPSANKVILCHDMMGGYITDKYVQGHRELGDYYFYHWSYIDAFIYFSHHFISLPPPVWTNAAHKNGVLSMGTIITEWEDGAKLCHSLLSEEWKVSQFCDQLVAMAVHYKIDGWLVNIENPIHPRLMDSLQMLITLLTTGMHAACPGSKVIWYDSVTVNGDLKWQNQLNYLNKSFFELCDGIFLNYNWNESVLETTRGLAAGRKGDVFVGVDVFGRGCFGGGGFNSYKAVEVISRQSLSCALFAPGWVYETQDKSKFFHNQDRFWSLLAPWIQCRGVSSLPLVTSFGRGYGESVSIDGKMVYKGPWTFQSAQNIQLSTTSLSSLQTSDPTNAVKIDDVALDTRRVYSNGTSLRLTGSVRSTQGINKPAIIKMFQTRLELTTPILVSVTYLCDQPVDKSILKVYLQLHTNDSPSRVFLDVLMPPLATETPSSVEDLPKSSQVTHLPGCVLAPLPSPVASSLLELFTGHTECTEPWINRYFILDPADIQSSIIEGVSLGVYLAGNKSESIPLSLTVGEIKIMPTHLLTSQSEVLNVRSYGHSFSDDGSSISLTLSWIQSDSPTDPIEHCNIYTATSIGSSWSSEFIYRGCSYSSNSYRLTDVFLLKDNGVASLTIVVQPVSTSHKKQHIDNCHRLVIEFTQ